MKKAFTIFAALFTMGAVMAQTIVSTEVEKRNVLIEEFTGVGCGYCPDGHARANAICEQYEGHAWSINIHAGGYATGSGYTTSDGDGIHNEFYSQISGYPCGVVNRGTVQDRGQWAATAASIRQEDAIVNIAAVGEYNSAEGTYTMHIETYYTGNSTQPTNYFNVAVTQDNILGQQSNYGNYNSEYIEGNQYRHMHMLRELLCGQWGIEIPATQGSFFDTTIVFDVPGSISGLDIPDPTDLNFIVFVTETHKNVLNAQKVIISWTAPKLNKVLVSQEADCSLQYNFTAVVVNNTVEDVQGVTLNVDGSDMDFNVLIPSLGSAEIALPSNTISVTGDAVQNCASTKSVSLVSFVNENNETVLVNGATKTADYAQFNIYTVAGPLRLQVAVDGWASEASVALIRQSDCSTEWTWRESTWTDIGPQSASAISQLYDGRSSWATFNPASGLYILRMLDSYGDGWAWTNNSNPSGVWLSDANGSVFADPWGYTNGPSFEQYDYYLNVTTNGDGSFVDIESVEPTVEFNVYPNPATERLNISCGEAVREVSLIDMAGRTVMTTGCVNSIDVSALASGVYVVRVATENGIGMQKFVKE